MSDEDSIDLRVRAARHGDETALVELWNLCGLTRWWNDPALDLKRFLEADNATFLVGESDGRIVASVGVGQDGRRGWLYYLAVHPGCRGRGYGRQLVRAAELWLSERRIPKIEALIRGRNVDAKGFYEALDYEHQPVMVMGRWLTSPGIPPGEQPDPDESGKLEVTITYLEMTSPPQEPVPHPPAGRRVALMRAEPPTVPFYRFLYNEIGRKWLWWERRALEDEALARVICDERVEIYVLYVNGAAAGLAELDRRHEPSIEIAYIGIMPEFIGQGFGPYLLASAIHTAWSYEPERLTVNTCTLDHPKALTLYQRFGFTPVERRTRVIDDPRLTGLIPPD